MEEYHAGSYIIEAECKLLNDKTTCSENPSCHWAVDPRDPLDPGSCKRDGTTVTTDELNQMLEAIRQKQIITSTRLDPLSIQAPDSVDKKVFVVKKLPSNSDKILRLHTDHFLKFRTQAPYPAFLAYNETPGLTEENNPPEIYAKYKIAKDRFLSMMRKNPIFLYAHEQPVEVLSPKEYAGTIGTVSIMPGAAEETRILILPHGPRKEKMLSSRNTTVLFDDEHLMEMQMQQKPAENLKDPRYTQFDKTDYDDDDDDYVYYTDVEKRDHPPLRSDQEWAIRNGQWTIVGYAGGGRRTRRTGRSRRSRKTRTLRKRNGCKLRKRINTRHTRHTRHIRHTRQTRHTRHTRHTRPRK